MSQQLQPEAVPNRHGSTITTSVSENQAKVHLKGIHYSLETLEQAVLD